MTEDASELWFIPEAWEAVDPIWQGRLQVILEDLVSLDHLRWCYVLAKDGSRLTPLLGPQGRTPSEEDIAPPERVTHLQAVLSASFEGMGEEMPTHLVEQSREGPLFIGFATGMVLVAAFDRDAYSGAVAMRFAKRVRHLISLQKTRDRGALYV